MTDSRDEAHELTASLGVCDGCGSPVLVWEVVGIGPDGVHTDAVVVCETCESSTE